MRRLALLACSALLITGCGSSITPGVEPPAESSSSTSAEPTGAAGSTPPQAPTSQTDTTTPMEPSDGTTSGPIITGTATSGEQALVLADAFSADSWSEGEYTRAGQGQPQKAMKVDVDCYSDGTREVIELRFAQPTGRFNVDVAQAMDSQSSNERLEFSLTTDGRLADAKTIPFTGVATLSAPLAGVTVVRVSVKPAEATADYRCSGDSTALITKMAIVQ